MRSRTVITLAVSAVAALGVTGTTMAFAGESQSARRPAVNVEASRQAQERENAAASQRVVREGEGDAPTIDEISRESAAEIALRLVGSGTVERIEHKRDSDPVIHLVTVVKGNERIVVAVNSRTGKAERDADAEKEDGRRQAERVAHDKARATAQEAVPDGYVMQSRSDDGGHVAEVIMRAGRTYHFVDVDMRTNTVIGQRTLDEGKVPAHLRPMKVTKQEADRIAERLVGGKADDAYHTLDSDDTKAVFVVGVVKGGEVHMVEVDAFTGKATRTGKASRR